EMAIYTLELINNDPTILPGVTLVMDTVADCRIDTRALKEAIMFYYLMLQIVQTYLSIDTGESTTKNNTYWGVIGPGSSEVSLPTAKLLGLFDISQISYAPTSPTLSDKQRYPYFFRTIASDTFQVDAMIQILKRNNWQYVSFIHDNNAYGNAAFDAFKSQIENTTICMAVNIRVPRTPDQQIIVDAVNSLLSKDKARVVVAFVSTSTLAKLVGRVADLGYANHFQWIGSDSWNASDEESMYQVIDGSLTFIGHSRPDNEFEHNLRQITLQESLSRNIFFAHYLAWSHHCSLQGNSNNSLPPCDGNLTLPNSTRIIPMLQTSANTVLAFAHAFNNAQRDLCNGTVCDEFKMLSGQKIREYLRNVSFIDGNQDTFHFDDLQDGPASYDVLRYNGRDRIWRKVGIYLNGESYEKGRGNITSLCSDSCPANQYMLISGTKSCCWHCISCEINSIVTYNVTSNLRNISTCKSCGSEHVADPNFQVCLPVPTDFLSFAHGWVWGVLCVSCVGLILTIITFALYAWNWETALVRASGRELSSMILIGVLLTFMLTFFFCFKPTKALCVMRRLSTGLSFTIIYSAVLVKTMRISFIFNSLGKKLIKDYKKLLRPMPQLILALVLTAVEVFLLIIWFVMQPPKVLKTRSNHHVVDYLQCEGMISHYLIIGLLYPILLVLLCTYYAIKVRKVPTGFNEAKHIGFAVYTALVICIAQIPTYLVNTSTNIVLRDAIYCLGNSLNGLIILFAMFGPKIYIIVFRPQKNNQ
uniref:G-protein coupled receptors family 3 profile domain-containing protein n=1 Tax=Ciona savignyi TaxID=51511 RepID=H2ZKW4_CIOSA